MIKEHMTFSLLSKITEAEKGPLMSKFFSE